MNSFLSTAESVASIITNVLNKNKIGVNTAQKSVPKIGIIFRTNKAEAIHSITSSKFKTPFMKFLAPFDSESLFQTYIIKEGKKPIKEPNIEIKT